VIDLYSRRLLGAATGLHPDAELAWPAIKMAVATRGGKDGDLAGGGVRAGHLPHRPRLDLHGERVHPLCRKLGIRQSMGRVGSCFDNAAAEAFFSSLEWEVLSRHEFADTRQAQAVVLDWCYGFYNHDRRTLERRHDEPHQLREQTAAPNREAA
jgi:putative transposase